MPLKDLLTHFMPFAALMATKPPPNRPALTRLSEQATVALIAAVGAVQYNAHESETQLAVLTAQVLQWQTTTQRVIDLHQQQLDRLRADLYTPGRSTQRP